jgi:hypothetical protein
MMRFEHIIEINDPWQHGLQRLTAAQLWRGLLLRVRHPEWFLEALESARVTEPVPGIFDRELEYGAFRVQDRVRVDDDLRIEIGIVSPPDMVGTKLIIQPEAPAPGALIVRFLYTTTGNRLDADLTAAEQRAREGAWLNADRDAIALIRRLAAAGMLGE